MHTDISAQSKRAKATPARPIPHAQGRSGDFTTQLQFAPQTLAPPDILQLQRTIGNRAVQRLLQRDSRASEPRAEQEATRVAPGAAPSAAVGSSVAAPAPAHADLFTPEIERTITTQRGRGQPLPDATRGRMEGALGADLGNVRVHTDASADRLSRSLEARAFTTGSDIFFKAGEFNPGGGSGQRLIAHELTHVLQQGAGKEGREGRGGAPAIQRMEDSELREKLGMPKYKKVDAAKKLPYFLSLSNEAVARYKAMPHDEFDKELLKLPGKPITQPAKNTPKQTQPKDAPKKQPQQTDVAPEKPKVDPEVEKQRVRELVAANFEADLTVLLDRFDKVDIEKESEVKDLLDDVIVRALITLLNESMLRHSENLKKVITKLHGLLVTAWTLDKSTIGVRVKNILTELAAVVPGIKDFAADPEVAKQATAGKNYIGERQAFMTEQRTTAKDVANPSLKVTKDLTIDGYKVLQWYNAATTAALPQFYDAASTPARSIHTRGFGREQENLAIAPNNWLNVWAQLKWKEEYVKHKNFGYGKPDRGTGHYGLLGNVQAGSKNFNIEDKLWVKEGMGTATRYNDLGSQLDSANKPQNHAKAIRQIVSGNFKDTTHLQTEAALAMLGAETARNPRSYGMGLMLLDLMENQGTYGSKGDKKYTFGKLLGASPHDKETNRKFEDRKTQATPAKQQRWRNMKDSIDTEAPQFSGSPFKALWAGKWPMSPSASMTLGTSNIPNNTSQLNTVQYKELKTILNWYINFMRGAQLNVKDEGEAKTSLMKLFRERLGKTAKMDGGSFKKLVG